jgi:hypothetical protein
MVGVPGTLGVICCPLVLKEKHGGYRSTHLDGWFLLKPLDFTEVWEQVRDGRYIDCTVILTVAPVMTQEFGCLWDVSKNKGLFIETAEMRFTRKLSAPEPPTRRGWFRRR